MKAKFFLVSDVHQRVVPSRSVASFRPACTDLVAAPTRCRVTSKCSNSTFSWKSGAVVASVGAGFRSLFFSSPTARRPAIARGKTNHVAGLAKKLSWWQKFSRRQGVDARRFPPRRSTPRVVGEGETSIEPAVSGSRGWRNRTELIKVTDESIMATAGLLGAIAGFACGGFWFSAALFAAFSLFSREQTATEFSKGLRGVARGTIDVLNYTAVFDDKYLVSTQVGQSVHKAAGQATGGGDIPSTFGMLGPSLASSGAAAALAVEVTNCRGSSCDEKAAFEDEIQASVVFRLDEEELEAEEEVLVASAD